MLCCRAKTKVSGRDAADASVRWYLQWHDVRRPCAIVCDLWDVVNWVLIAESWCGGEDIDIGLECRRDYHGLERLERVGRRNGWVVRLQPGIF